MSENTFKKIIAQLKEINFSGELHFYSQDEPFLDKKIIEKVHYAKREMPNIKPVIITNFTMLTEDKIQLVLSAPISYFSCSLYALKKENYEKICGRDNFNKAFINQIKFIKEFAKTEPFSFGLYLMNDVHNQDDIEFCKYFLQEIAPVSLIKFYETFRLFNTPLKLRHNSGFINHCIYDRVQFTNDVGDVSLCSIDAGNKMKIGTINKDNAALKELINSGKAVEIRRRMLKNKSKEAYCRYCEFGKYENKLLYFLPIPEKAKRFLNNRFTDSYKNEYASIRFNKKQILERLSLFNEIFKDGKTEDEWLNALKELREDFYKNKINLYKNNWGSNVKVKI
jgi:MoaA/NifB/PqqE/SkfB family radical SAM enzyme